MADAEAAPVPGPGFVAGLVVSSWLDASPTGDSDPTTGDVAWLLIAHPPPRRHVETFRTIEAGLRALVAGMGLLPAAERVPGIGDRLMIRGPVVALDYGHDEYLLRLPAPGREWRDRVGRGGQVCVAVVLDPLRPATERETEREAVNAHLRRSAAAGRAFMGVTRARHRGGRAGAGPARAACGRGASRPGE
ncbi:hypothetical protein AB0I22_26560 [Streptomyces sp. NPDC050610]|uniref:hypothetical protein n=1 Tax=Streptomyces sp. NPDC050610 TaxID=3157097 RepID=UPI00342371D3